MFCNMKIVWWLMSRLKRLQTTGKKLITGVLDLTYAPCMNTGTEAWKTTKTNGKPVKWLD